MINLNIKYSIETEVERIQETLGRIDFYTEKGYSLKFPKDLQFDDGEGVLLNMIRDSVVSEYDETIYKKEDKYINDNISVIDASLNNFSTKTSIPLHDSYEVQLTRYGVGGSYSLPNKILINIQVRSEEKLLKTLIHEIIHLSIEKLIGKYNVGHWEKERIVDLIFEKFAPELNIMQNLPIETKPIDEVFERYYPNVEEVIKNVK